MLGAFLRAYGWKINSDFAGRAMTMTLLHEFNPLDGHLPPFDDIGSLHDLATRLWQL